MLRYLVMLVAVSVVLLISSGCFTVGLFATDKVSAAMAKEESPEQEAREGAAEHAVEEVGKATQAGVQKIKDVKRKAIETVTSGVK